MKNKSKLIERIQFSGGRILSSIKSIQDHSKIQMMMALVISEESHPELIIFWTLGLELSGFPQFTNHQWLILDMIFLTIWYILVHVKLF